MEHLKYKKRRGCILFDSNHIFIIRYVEPPEYQPRSDSMAAMPRNRLRNC